MTIDELRTRRRELAHRRRRMIFNNDGDELYFEGVVDRKTFLERRTTGLIGSHVDAVWYYSTYGLKLFYEDGPFRRFFGYPPLPSVVENYPRFLADTGKDALEVMIETCHAHGLEIFYSNRINDTHDSFNPKKRRYVKADHPDMLLSTEAEAGKYPFPDVRSFWAAWNFELAEVRRMVCDHVRAICETYDIDGLDLDFLRHPVFFPPTMQCRQVEAQHLEMMTGLLREIREMTEVVGMRRGRPIPISARCCFDVALSRSVGIDVPAWLDEGLIDILIAGRFLESTLPAKPLVDLAHCHDVPCYTFVAMSDYKEWTPEGDPKGDEDLMMYRGDALVRHDEGADGLFIFNIFDPHSPMWWELGDPDILRTLDRSYVWDYMPSYHYRDGTLWGVSGTFPLGRAPVVVTPRGCHERIPLIVGENLSAEAPLGQERTLTLRVHTRGLSPRQGLTVKVNGRSLPKEHRRVAGACGLPKWSAAGAGESPDGLWLEFLPDAGLFRRGTNVLGAVLDDQGAGSVQIDNVRLDVRCTAVGNE